MENASIPVAKHAIHAMTSSVLKSNERLQMNVHEFGLSTTSFYELSQKSHSDMITHQIRASFQKLRVRLVEELKNTSTELAEEILRETKLRMASSNSNPGLREGQSLFVERSASVFTNF